MKKVALFATIILALAMCASAQTLIDFSDLPSSNLPILVPTDYPASSYLDWANFNYVSPLLWSGAGPGFFNGPAAKLAFVGGPLCNSQATVCNGSIKIPVAPNSTASFQPLSASLASGWVANNVVVVAYNRSQLLGSVTWNLTTSSQVFNFPSTWTTVTQLTFYMSPAHGQQGSMVMYTLTANINP